jgi:hypothetical protein
MTERTRLLSAVGFFLVGALVMATLLVELPPGTTTTSFLVASIGWFVLYPVARLTWAREMAKWRYWLIGAVMAVGVPLGESARRSQFGPGPSPILQWLTVGILAAVVIVGLVRMRFRRE